MNFIDEKIKVNGIDIAYQLHGNNQNPTILLVHGLAVPLTGWPTDMVESFVNQGFQVLLIDNRDMGKSQELNHVKIPPLLWTILKFKLGFSPKVPYKLEDMMTDVICLLDALHIDKVHLVGASMGGMIAQLVAIHHPERLHTLTSIMSTTGYKALPKGTPEINKVFAEKPASSSFEDRLHYHMKKWRVMESPQYPLVNSELESRVSKLLERGISTKGTIRQILAIFAASDRTKLLNSILTPTLVIHGDSDGLVHCDGGVATSNAIKNAKLKIYKGMGHDFPVELIPSIISDIVEHVTVESSKIK
jgi:pimeloyl-ACP methyl ester carboxylesterase